MAGTMTWVGLDVHARSTHAAAIDAMTGELTGLRFGPGIEGPVAWLAGVARPGAGRVMRRARRGSGSIARRAAAGIAMEVIAPGKTPRGAVGSGQDRSQGRRAVGAAAAGRVADRGGGAAAARSRPPAR